MNTPQSPATQDSSALPIHAGLQVPFLIEGKSSPSFLSAAHGNLITTFIRALSNCQVNVLTADLTADGVTYNTHAEVRFAADAMVIDIYIPPATTAGSSGTANVILGRVVTEFSEYITIQPIISTGDGTYSDTADAEFNSAKPFQLRGLTGSQIQPEYTDATYFRIFSAQGPTGKTGVYVSGLDVNYQDINVDARIPTPAAGGGVITCYYQSTFDNYWLCSQNSGGTGTAYRVAKPPELRNSITSETIYGQTFAYVYAPAGSLTGPSYLFRSSTRSSDSNVEYQAVIPEPQVNYLMKIMSDANTGVITISADTGVATGTAVIYADVTNHGMAWTALNDQTYGH